MPDTFMFDVLLTRTETTKFSLRAESNAQATAIAHEIIRNQYVELGLPKATDYKLESVRNAGAYTPRYVVTPHGYYFVLENFDVDLAKAKCYGCPDLHSMHTILKIVHGMEKDDVEGCEYHLIKHDAHKYHLIDDRGICEIINTLTIEDWLRDFTM